MGRFKSKCGTLTISDTLLDIANDYAKLNVENGKFLRIVLEKIWYLENLQYNSEELFTDRHFEFYVSKGFQEAFKGFKPN